ncbi:MAG: hypothetical protein WBD20_22715 [Pirellulaceae bacterium]
MKNVFCRLACIALLLLAFDASSATAQLSAVGKVLETAENAAASASGQKSVEEFRAWATAYVANPQGDLSLPKEWFDRHFDAATAQKLNAEYRQTSQMIARFPSEVAKQRAQGKTNLVVAMHTKAIDPTATGWQNAALQRMTSPTPLYSLRMIAPGKTTGFSLVSFVYADNRFAWAGKLSALHDPGGDLATKVLCTSSIESMEKPLREKGLIKSSGAEHLQQAGVLK